jgi:capsular exopolysaccharide synthesis family protein
MSVNLRTVRSSVNVLGVAGRTAPRRGSLIPGAEELFRSLYTGFDVTGGTSIAVCSAISGEGKTTISLGLAVTIAQDLPDRRVVVVETDLWRPVLAADFGLDPDPGLVDCLLDRLPLQTALRTTALDNLMLLTAGTITTSAQRLLRSSRMPEVISALRSTHDVIIVDTPATLAHSEVGLLTRMVEDVIFVVRTGVTPESALATALGRLQGAKVRGIVVNDARSAVPQAIRRLIRF